METKLKNKIIAEIKSNQPEVYWDHNDILEKEQVKNIIENGVIKFEEELWEMNIDHICNLENSYLKNIFDEFEKDVEINFDEFEEEFREFVFVNLNFKELLNTIGDITVNIIAYSNYDCTNSFDTYDTKEKETYLYDVFQRVKNGVKLSDYMFEHMNGAYGGALFQFSLKMSLTDFLELKENSNKAKFIKIPKGTQFGFFSSFQGSSSLFDKTTYKDIKISIDGETEYDSFGIESDIERSYNFYDVFGNTEFIENGEICLINYLSVDSPEKL